jgi:CRP-like cAMP-binding protein
VSTASELIRQIDFFQPLDHRLIDKIARLCITREYSPGDYIVRQGDPALGLYFIIRGSARVEIARDGAITPVAELHAGEFVGELSVIDKKPRSANVVCATDTSCLLLTRDSFMKLLNKHPEIALQMVKALAARLRTTDERIWQGAVAMPERVPQENGPDARESRSPTETQPRSDKQKIKDMLADTVGWVYLLKSITQFSLALVGCPVNVNLETRASHSLVSTAGPLKMVLVPSRETHLIGVHAFGDGAFKVTIFQPVITPGFTGVSVCRFCAPVRRNESVWLRIPAFERARIEPGATLSGVVHIDRRTSAQGGMRDLETAFDL